MTLPPLPSRRMKPNSSAEWFPWSLPPSRQVQRYTVVRVALHCGPYATTSPKCVSLLASGSLRFFSQEAVWECTERTGAATAACEITTAPRVSGGFGYSTASLTTTQSARLSVQRVSNTNRSATLEPWGFVVPTSTTQHALWLGKDRCMRFENRAYRSLVSLTPQAELRWEFTIKQVDTLHGASADTRNHDARVAAYYLHMTVGLPFLVPTIPDSSKSHWYAAMVCLP